MPKNKKMSTKTLVVAAVLVAISIVLSRFCVIYITPSVRISFGNIPIIIASLMFGPLVGALVGAASDLLGAAFLSGLGWYPWLTVTPILIGIIPAVLCKLIKNRRSFVAVFAVVLTADVVGPMCWSTYWLSELYNTPIFSLAVVRVPLYIGIAVLESVVIFLLMKTGIFKGFNFSVGKAKNDEL